MVHTARFTRCPRLASVGSIARVSAVLFCGLSIPCQDQDRDRGVRQPPDGFIDLLSSGDLSGWWGLRTENPAQWKALPPEELREKIDASRKAIEKHWHIEDGVLINDGHGLFLSTIEDYGDFELFVDYKTVAGADSGVYLRGVPQVQIWDYTEAGGKWRQGADKGSGGLWNNAKGTAGRDPLVLADKPFGQWNRFHIHLVGERVTVVLNDKLHYGSQSLLRRTHPGCSRRTLDIRRIEYPSASAYNGAWGVFDRGRSGHLNDWY